MFMHLKTRRTLQQWEEIIKDGIKPLTYFSKLKKKNVQWVKVKSSILPSGNFIGKNKHKCINNVVKREVISSFVCQSRFALICKWNKKKFWVNIYFTNDSPNVCK